MIKLRGISKSFGTNPVLDQLDLELYPDAVTAIAGPNGEGKTTILNLICGILSPDQGTVEYEGCSPRDCFAVLSGENGMYHKNTVRENIYYMGALRKRTKAEMERNINSVRQHIPLYDEVCRQLYERLSLGQKRSMTLFGAMATDPKIITLDEPTEGLDLEHKRQIVRILSLLKAERTIVLITHDPQFLCDAADRILFLKGGRIVKESPKTSEDIFLKLYQNLYGEEA